MNKSSASSLLAISLLFAVGCGPTGGDGPDANDQVEQPPGFPDAGPNPDWSDAAPAKACNQMDILFVIDDSGSMSEEQDNLATNLPMFIDTLDTLETEDGTPIHYRVAVTSTGRTMNWTTDTLGFPLPDSQIGHDGEMLSRCGMAGRWLEKEDPDIRNTFACAAELGVNGATQEMPLYATKLALGDRMADGTNNGFLRNDALLAIVILTDEDDCSREDNDFTLGLTDNVCDAVAPVQSYKTFLDQASGGAGRWAVATIAGPGPGPCDSDFGKAQEAVRLKEFTALAGANGVFSSICEGDLSPALKDAVATLEMACENIVID